MGGIDLIPASYRADVRARRALGHIALLLGAAATIAALCGATIAWKLRAERAGLADLQSKVASVSTLREQVDALKALQAGREQTQIALAALRGERDVPLLLAALDQAVSDGLWLVSLRFERLLRQSGPAKASPAGVGATPISNVAEVRVEQEGQTWLLGNRVEISGGAANQTQLAKFIDVLSAQKGIAEVRFLSSSIKHDRSASVVQFSAEATIGEGGRRQ